MINERIISEKFSAAWKQNFPLLTANFMRVFNETQINMVNKKPVPIIENVRHDLIAEIAFNLTESLIDKNIEASNYLSIDKNLSFLVSKTAKKIWTTGNYSSEDLKLTSDELDQIIELYYNIEEFIKTIKRNSFQFRPTLTGYSFIPDLEADLLIDNTLYEVKTVNRNFRSSDLKQLFIYLALKQVSKDENWEYAGLYNPRRGVYCKFNIKTIVYNLSGGIIINEAFENLLNGLVRDIEIDSKF